MRATPEKHETPRPAKERLTAITFAQEPYTSFNRWMDQELTRLVARWQHLAAPNARQTRSFRRGRRA